MQLGESFVGVGSEAAHLNTVLGNRRGQVGQAWTTALATPREGHASFVVVARPNVPVLPMTLFVNKATIAGADHARLTWGAAQLGVASGVLDAVHQGSIDESQVHELCIIAAVWVDPAASDEDLVYENNRAATRRALRHGALREPEIEEVMAFRDEPLNGYYVPPTLRSNGN